MIDVGDESGKNKLFLENLEKCLIDLNKPTVSNILLSHANPNHMGGLNDVLELLKSVGQKSHPKVNKKLDGNQNELNIIKQSGLSTNNDHKSPRIFDIKPGQIFTSDNHKFG